MYLLKRKGRIPGLTPPRLPKGHVRSTPGEREKAGDALKVIIYESELEKMAQFASLYENIETGGDFFGFWTHSGAPVVQLALGPGAKCRRTSTSFFQDVGYLKRVHAHLYARHGLQNIGEWHSHHKLGLDRPSRGDEATLRKGLHSHGLDKFMLMIATLAKEERCVYQNYFITTPDGDGSMPLHVKVLRGVSPIRLMEEKEGNIFEGSELPRQSIAPWKWKTGPHSKMLETGETPSYWFQDPEFHKRLKSIKDDFTLPTRMELTQRQEILFIIDEKDTLTLPGKAPETLCTFSLGRNGERVLVNLADVSYEKYLELKGSCKAVEREGQRRSKGFLAVL